MGNTASTPSTATSANTTQTEATASSGTTSSGAAPGGQPKCKPCCACPETRKVRDECVIQKGEEACGDLIKAHQDCMRGMGFNI